MYRDRTKTEPVDVMIVDRDRRECDMAHDLAVDLRHQRYR
jgi:hypothetical protein